MDKRVIRTEAAPAPFQGAPYNQAIVAGELVFVAGQLGLKPGDTAIEGDVATQTGQALSNLAAILDATWCSKETREAVETKVVAPLVRMASETDAKRRAETAATKVDFFTMVRGED